MSQPTAPDATPPKPASESSKAAPFRLLKNSAASGRGDRYGGGPVIVAVVPGENGPNGVKPTVKLVIGEPHPDDPNRPAREGGPSPVVDLAAWVGANRKALQAAGLEDAAAVARLLNERPAFRALVQNGHLSVA